MRAIRHILSDRILATALAVVIAYVLVLQAAVGGYARASTISPADNPAHVICASYGVTNAEAGGSNNPLDKSADCPCALLCRLAGSMVPAIVANFTVFTAITATLENRITLPENAIFPQQQRRLLAEPRAPPLFL